MITSYCSLDDTHLAPLPPHLREVVCDCIQNLVDAYGTEYDPDNDGFVVLFSRDTTDQDALDLFGKIWTDACLEGVIFDKEANCFLTCILTDNQFGYTIIVPDAPWLDPDFRIKLLSELVDCHDT